MLNTDLYKLLDGLNNCPRDPEYEDPKEKKNRLNFLCLVSENKIAVRQALDVLDDISKESDEFLKFKAEREEMLANFALKDENGKPIFTETHNKLQSEIQGKPIVTRVYKMSKEKREEEKFNNEIKKLNSKFQKAIDGQETKNKEFDVFLKQQVKSETMKKFEKINMSILPDNLNQAAMDGLVFILKK